MNAPAISRVIRLFDRFAPQSSIGTGSLYTRRPSAPNEWFVDGQNGSDSNDGRDPDKPLLTIAGALAKVQSGDTIYLTGNFAEEAGQTPHNVEDVRVIGLGTKHRHADAARDAKTNSLGFTNQNSGASWRPPAVESGTTPLLTLVHQGWVFENILFVPPSDDAAIYLDHSVVSGADDGGGGHATFRNCRFAGGAIGIGDDDGAGFVLIDNCWFQDQTDSGIKTISTAWAIPLLWEVKNSYFTGNANHIRVSASRWLIHDNYFGPIDDFGIDLQFVSAQGANNIVTKNYLSGDYDGEYLGGTGDEWAGNMSMDTGSAEVGAEGWTTAAPVA